MIIPRTASESEHYAYRINIFGPFIDMGLGKPTHQNFLSQFIDGLVIQAIDVNQDSVISQSFFIPNVLAEFAKDPKVIACVSCTDSQRTDQNYWLTRVCYHH